ncbi:MAG: Mov34/MPN/PAD-1 family protein [Promethearchaeota archaeon]
MKSEKDVILFINTEIAKDIEICVDKASPNEACGLIFGKILEHQKSNSEFEYHYNSYKYECMESSEKSPVAFLMDDYPKLIDISKLYSKNYNYQLLSIFHSHPGSAYPSGVDIPYMESFYKSGIPKFKHIIWTIMDANSKELNGFLYILGELNQISIKIRKM